MPKKITPKWVQSRFRGVRYREHPIRKHGLKKDRYYSIRFQASGKRHEEGAGWGTEGMTEQKAALLLAELKECARKGEQGCRLKERREMEEHRLRTERAERARREKSEMTFGQFFDDFYIPSAEISKGKKSVYDEKNAYRKHLDGYLGQKRFAEIGPLDIERVVVSLQKKELSDRSIQFVVWLFGRIWRLALRDGFATGEPPSKMIPLKKLNNARVRFFSRKEVPGLFDQLKIRSPQTHDICLLSLNCGLRFGEIAALRWSDVDFSSNGGTLWIRNPKNQQGRFAYLTKATTKMLKERGPGKANALIFPSRNGNVLRLISMTFGRTVEDLGLNANVEDSRQKIVFHSLRHTYASWLAMEGVPLYSISKLLGHSDSKMTQRYAHLCPDNLRATSKVFE